MATTPDVQIDPHDLLGVDHLLSDEEQMLRDTLILGQAITGERAFA
jgi:hypothetical protein